MTEGQYKIKNDGLNKYPKTCNSLNSNTNFCPVYNKSKNTILSLFYDFSLSHTFFLFPYAPSSLNLPLQTLTTSPPSSPSCRNSPSSPPPHPSSRISQTAPPSPFSPSPTPTSLLTTTSPATTSCDTLYPNMLINGKNI